MKKGTYTITTGVWVNASACQIVDDKEQIIVKLDSGKRKHTFTLLQDTYCTLRFKVTELEVWANIKNIQIERGETATAYVAHDSRYYEPDGQNAIVLRSLPDGVCDTFNLQTGEYTRRIGEAVLDGDEDIVKGIDDTDYVNTIEFYINRVVNVSSNKNSICDSYIYKYKNEDTEHFYTDNKRVVVFIQKTKLSSQDVDGFKQYLQSNPLTVQYELATPVTTIIPRTIKRNNNGTISTIDFGTYTNKESLALPNNPSYLTINSTTSIKPVVEPITYIDFKTRLKANTDYSIIMDKNSVNKTINLGGTSKTYANKMLVRTPSIDLEQNLRISGSGSIRNIMVIEGDVLDKELQYFNGMCNVKMPIVRNCGKNLFNINDLDSSKTSIINDREFQTTNFNLDTYINIKVKPNTTYSICLKAYKDGGNASGLVMCIHDGKNTRYHNTTSRLATIANVPSAYDYRSTVFTTKSDYISLSSLNSVFIKDLTIIESNTVDTDYIPYRGNDICIAQGEIGLSQDMFEQGGFSANNGSGSTYETMKYDSTIRLRSKSLIRVKPNTTYYIKNNLPRVIFNLYQWNASVEFMQGTSKTNNASELLFTTTNDTHYIHFLFSKYGNENIAVSEFDWSLFQLVELDSTVQLRSLPNGVKDELNLLTGE